MHSHGQAQLRRCRGCGQEAAGRAKAQLDEPFFSGFVG